MKLENHSFRKNEMTCLELYAGLDSDMTKVTTSLWHSGAVSLHLSYDTKRWLSRFGVEVVRPLRAPFAKGDEPCII
jgi:hypothetical protein